MIHLNATAQNACISSFSFQSLISTVPPIVIIGEKFRQNTCLSLDINCLFLSAKTSMCSLFSILSYLVFKDYTFLLELSRCVVSVFSTQLLGKNLEYIIQSKA